MSKRTPQADGSADALLFICVSRCLISWDTIFPTYTNFFLYSSLLANSKSPHITPEQKTSTMDAPDIVRDDWVYQGGILFYAKVGPCEIPRVESSDLRKEFLPKMTSEGERRIARWSKSGAPDSFVRAQLKHYGVQFDESDLSGNGVDLLTKVLEDGKCDSVPQHTSLISERKCIKPISSSFRRRD